MSRLRLIRVLPAGLVLLAAHGGSLALSLGSPQGQALLGQPLDLAVPVQFDSSDSVNGQCVAVEVWYADEPLPEAMVRTAVTLQRGQLDGVLRIRTGRPVNEPVVSLAVTAGCAPRITRRYVLLADVPSLARAPMTLGSPEGLPRTTVPRAAAPLKLGPGAGVGGAPAPRRAAPPAVGPRGAAASRSPREPGLRTERARLQLAPAAELAIERNPTLKNSADLQAVPQSDNPQRGAAAALWRALNQELQQSVQNTERIAALEAEIAALKKERAQSASTIAGLSRQLSQSQDERYANPLVYALAAVAALALAALGGLAWRTRQRPRGAWWDSDEEASAGETEVPVPAPQVAEPPPAPVPADAPPAPALAPLGAMGHAAPSGFAGPQPGQVEALLDLQQQVAFFESLGQQVQAAAVLQRHIDGKPATSPWAYLELFHLYQAMGRMEEFDRLKRSFHLTFNAHVPPFADTGEAGVGLEASPDTLARIAALWPSAGGMAMIETLLCQPTGDCEEVLTLNAYRELLLLCAVGHEALAMPAVAPSAPRGGARSWEDRDHPTTVLQPLAEEPAHEPTLPVDIDLSTLTRPPVHNDPGLDFELPKGRGSGTPR